MSDAFESPSEPPSRFGALAGAGCLYLVAAGAGFLLVLGLLQDAWFLRSDLDTQPGNVLIGMAIGVVLRTGFLGLVTAGAVAGARALLHPEQHGPEALATRELQAIYAQRRLDEAPQTDPGRYADRSAEELTDIYRNIDPEAAPERFEQLLAAIKAAVEK